MSLLKVRQLSYGGGEQHTVRTGPGIVNEWLPADHLISVIPGSIFTLGRRVFRKTGEQSVKKSQLVKNSYSPGSSGDLPCPVPEIFDGYNNFKPRTFFILPDLPDRHARTCKNFLGQEKTEGLFIPRSPLKEMHFVFR